MLNGPFWKPMSVQKENYIKSLSFVFVFEFFLYLFSKSKYSSVYFIHDMCVPDLRHAESSPRRDDCRGTNERQDHGEANQSQSILKDTVSRDCLPNFFIFINPNHLDLD